MYKTKRTKVLNPKKGCDYIFLPQDASRGTKQRTLQRVAEVGARKVESDYVGELFEVSAKQASELEGKRAQRAEAKDAAERIALSQDIVEHELAERENADWRTRSGVTDEMTASPSIKRAAPATNDETALGADQE